LLRGDGDDDRPMGLVQGGQPEAPHPVGPTPLTRAHAHNDYEHPRPLLMPLDQGFCSVEADVWLTGGELRVGHELSATAPGRTLIAST